MDRRQRIFALLTVTLAIAAALALCEVSLRVIEWGKETYAGPPGETLMADSDELEGGGIPIRLSSDPQLAYELPPGAQDQDTNISSQGLRDREYTEAKPTGSYRIAFIGDSIAYGYGVRQREAIPKVLERLLNSLNESGARSITNYEVLNFGVPGYTSSQITRRMMTTVSRFHPDLIIYLYCLNDADQKIDDVIVPLLKKLDPSERESTELRMRLVRSPLSGLRLYSLTIRALDSLGLLPSQFGQNQDLVAVYADQSQWSQTVRDIARMASEARRIGADFVGVISPIFGENGEEYQKDYPLNAVHAQVADAFRLAGIPVLDLAPEIGKRDTRDRIGRDQWHYSVEGNQVVASILLDFLLKENLLSPLSTISRSTAEAP